MFVQLTNGKTTVTHKKLDIAKILKTSQQYSYKWLVKMNIRSTIGISKFMKLSEILKIPNNFPVNKVLV